MAVINPIRCAKIASLLALSIFVVALGIRPGVCQEFPFGRPLLLTDGKPAGTRNEFKLVIREDGAVSGLFWCNSWGGGKAVLEGRKLSVDWKQAVSTAIACPVEVMKADYHVFEVLGKAEWEMKGNMLVLSSAVGKLRFVVVPQ